VVFVADDLADWLIGLLADRARKRLSAVVLGTDQERALRSAATASVRLVAEELCPDYERAEHLALVISQVFEGSDLAPPLVGDGTILEALQAGITRQLAVLDDVSLTGTGQSSADVLGVPGTVLAEKLAAYLVQQIVVRGSRGGPLFPLASQLNDDVTHLQGQQIQDTLRELCSLILETLAQFGTGLAATAPTPAQLPPSVPEFTGRDGDLRLLAELLDPRKAPGPVVVSAVAGLAGVGKTSLAVQAGHAALRRGWFGGGVLFIDMHGYDDRRIDAAQALEVLLRALAVPSERIPPNVEERAALYRSMLARIGQSVLVIADNASSEAQVRPLLPGIDRHRMLVTSRHTLAGLGSRLIDITVLSKEASLKLLDAALRVAWPEDDRIDANPQASSRLVAICAGLPLALQIAAALLKADTTLSVNDLADLLSNEAKRLKALRYDDGAGSSAPSIEAAFELSYRRLSDPAARMFRLLSVDPVSEISTAAAAALAGISIANAQQLLADLARAHLIDVTPGRGGRRRMHDLVRLYARQLSEEYVAEDGWEQAVDRLLGYYLHSAAAADARLSLQMTEKMADSHVGSVDAKALQDIERGGLVAAATLSHSTGRNRSILIFPLLLAVYRDWQRPFDAWLAAANFYVIDIGRRMSIDRTSLASILEQVRLFGEAAVASPDAPTILITTGHPNERTAIGIPADSLRQVHRFEVTLQTCQEATAVFGWTRYVVTTPAGFAISLQLVRRFEETLRACREAASLFQGADDHRHESTSLTELADALQEVCRFGDAILAFKGVERNT
jgi:hypothetical protein